MLGTDLAEKCRRSGIEARVLDLPEFDITDTDKLQSEIAGGKIIINCAAYTNVEKAESERELAYEINAEAVGRLGEFAAVAGAYLLHVSTDFVFDGRSEVPYRESDPTNPISVYGASKLAGEKLLAETKCRHCIMRVEWTYGSGGNNFVKKLIKAAKTRKMLNVVDDQIGSPTATTEVARAICEMIAGAGRPEGIYHFAATGYVSRYEMARFIFEKRAASINITACKTSDYASAAARPLNSRFNCDKIASLLGREIEPWQGPLERFLEQL